VLSAAGMAFAACQTVVSDPEMSGVFFATGQGNFSGTMGFLAKLHDKGARFASPIEFPNLVMSGGAGALSLQFGMRGELLTLTHRRLAGLHALCFAFEALQSKRLSLALAAGAEELSAARARCGELLGQGPLGEGAAALVLVDGPAPVRLSAVAMSGSSATSPDEVIERCLKQAGLATAEIVTLPNRGELDVAGLLDAAHAFELIVSGQRESALCVERDAAGSCAVLFEKGAL